jgi:hypothetical protein
MCQLDTSAFSMVEEQDLIWNNNGGTGNLMVENSKNETINVSKLGKDDKKLFDIFISL